MEIINLSDVKKLIGTAHATLCILLRALETKTLIGEINRPEAPVEKIKRKRRTKKEMGAAPKMDLEKEYQSEKTSDLIFPDADGSHPLYGKKRREKKGAGVE